MSPLFSLLGSTLVLLSAQASPIIYGRVAVVLTAFLQQSPLLLAIRIAIALLSRLMVLSAATPCMVAQSLRLVMALFVRMEKSPMVHMLAIVLEVARPVQTILLPVVEVVVKVGRSSFVSR